MTPEPPKPLLLVRVVRTAVRLTLVVGILLSGVVLMQTWHLLFHERGELPVRAGDAGGFAGLPDGLFADGTWRLGGGDWSFDVASVSPDTPDPEVDPLPPGGGKRGSDLDGAVLDWLRTAGATVTGDGRLREYRLDRNGSRIRAATQGDGREEVVLWARLDRTTGDRVSRMEFRRRATTSPANAGPIELPPGVRTLATRIDGGGRVQARFVGPIASPGETRKHWADCGWEAASPFVTDGGVTGFRLNRGTDAVDVWRYRGTEAASREYLLLVRGK